MAILNRGSKVGLSSATNAVKMRAELLLGYDSGSVWGVGITTACKEGRVEVCFNEQRDGSPGGYTFERISRFGSVAVDITEAR